MPANKKIKTSTVVTDGKLAIAKLIPRLSRTALEALVALAVDAPLTREQIEGHLPDHQTREHRKIAVVPTDSRSEGMGFFAALPHDLMLDCLSHLPVSSALIVSRTVCKGWMCFMNEAKLWATVNLCIHRPYLHSPAMDERTAKVMKTLVLSDAFAPGAVKNLHLSDSSQAIDVNILKKILKTKFVHSLTCLQLSGKITDAVVKVLCGAAFLPTLTSLNLNAKCSEGVVLDVIAKMPKLHKLAINCNVFQSTFATRDFRSALVKARGGEPLLTDLAIDIDRDWGANKCLDTMLMNLSRCHLSELEKLSLKGVHSYVHSAVPLKLEHNLTKLAGLDIDFGCNYSVISSTSTPTTGSLKSLMDAICGSCPALQNLKIDSSTQYISKAEWQQGSRPCAPDINLSNIPETLTHFECRNVIVSVASVQSFYHPNLTSIVLHRFDLIKQTQEHHASYRDRGELPQLAVMKTQNDQIEAQLRQNLTHGHTMKVTLTPPNPKRAPLAATAQGAAATSLPEPVH